jgi:RecJ-like exonuclease
LQHKGGIMENENRIGIVSSIKFSHNPLDNIYTVICDKSIQLKSSETLELLDIVEINGESAKFLKKGDRKDYEKLASALVANSGISQNTEKINLEGKAYEQIAHVLIKAMQKSAEVLVKGFLSGAPIVVRFHNDGDGSSGAIAMCRAFVELEGKLSESTRSVSWQMNKSIAYSKESFYADRMLFESYKSVERPIVLIVDFGTSPESEDAIRLAEPNCDMVWLDHHVLYDAFPKEKLPYYTNVSTLGGDSSFTACIFAEMMSGVDVEDLKAASLISDYSKYGDYKDANAVKNSLILDFLTSSSNDLYSKPKQMDIILKDPEKSENFFRHASNNLEDAIDAGIKNIRNYKTDSGINISVLDFGHIAKLNLDYPLPGRYSSKLQSHIETENNGKTITLVHYGSYISIRISGDISDSVDLLGLIERLKTATEGSITGGGHKQAASIKSANGNMTETLHMLLMELGVRNTST